MKNSILFFFLVFVIALAGCGGQEAQPEDISPADEAVEIYISAAASLTEALTEIQSEYANHSNAVLVFNFAGSGTLQKQILEGAPCDIFISASKEHMDSVEEAGLIFADSRIDLLNNTLTLIGSAELKETVPNAENMDLDELLTAPEITNIAIGTPESVPAGKYASESLQSLGIWDKLQSKLVPAKDVKQVLEYVESGNADLGLVYKTDALLLETGFIVLDMPENSHSPIVYPSALLSESIKTDAVAAFYEFLQSDYAESVFEKYGFKTL